MPDDQPADKVRLEPSEADIGAPGYTPKSTHRKRWVEKQLLNLWKTLSIGSYRMSEQAPAQGTTIEYWTIHTEFAAHASVDHHKAVYYAKATCLEVAGIEGGVDFVDEWAVYREYKRPDGELAWTLTGRVDSDIQVWFSRFNKSSTGRAFFNRREAVTALRDACRAKTEYLGEQLAEWTETLRKVEDALL